MAIVEGRAVQLAKRVKDKTIRSEEVPPGLPNTCPLVLLSSFPGSHGLSWLMLDTVPSEQQLSHEFLRALTINCHVQPCAPAMLPLSPLPASPGNLFKSSQQSSREKRINLYQHCISLHLSPYENKRETVQSLIQYSPGVIPT